MKQLLIFIVLLCSSIANADSLKPLDQIATKNNLINQDLATVSYIYLRCSAAYTVMSSIGARMNMSQQKSNELMGYSTDYLVAAVDLDVLKEESIKTKKKATKKELFDLATSRVVKLIDLYWVDLKDNKDKTGDHFSGSFLSDVDFCSSLGKK